MSNKNVQLELLRKLESNPFSTQRELSQEMGISLGKINYCMKKLTEMGWIKINNFKNSSNKLSYIYLLTPQGLKHKAKLTSSFLKIKMVEYEMLRKEISRLKLDARESSDDKL